MRLQMAQMNHRLSGIDTLFMSTNPLYSFLVEPHQRGRNVRWRRVRTDTGVGGTRPTRNWLSGARRCEGG